MSPEVWTSCEDLQITTDKELGKFIPNKRKEIK